MSSGEADSQTSTTASSTGAVTLDPDRIDLPNTAVGTTSETSARTEVGLVLRVVDSFDQPITDAVMTWSALRDVDPEWPWIDSAEQLGLTGAGVASTEDGRWQHPPAPPDTSRGSVVWVTHPRQAARAFVLREVETLAALPDPIRLESATGIEVRVVDASGAPCAGAELHQRFELERVDRAAATDPALDARAALWRVVRTNSRGEALLPSIPGRQAIHAQDGARSSSTWRGTAPARVTLVVAETILCRGRVTSEVPGIDFTQSVVRAVVRMDGAAVRLGGGAVLADGRVEPFRIPALDGERYEFELAGGRVAPTTIHRPISNSTGVVYLEFVARAGTRFPVRIVDPAGEPVAGAVVGWAWPNGETWEWWRLGTDRDGRCEAECVPAGMLWLEVSKPGFLPFRQEFEQTGDFAPAYEIKLERGGVLRGRVTAASDPVREFRVVVMKSGDPTPSGLREHFVRDAEDGRFMIDGVPLGELAVFAFAEGRARSATKTAAVTIETPAVVELDLPAAVAALGFVRDSRTFQPVVGATVQCWIDADVATLRAWGPVGLSDAEGRFEIAGAPPDAGCVVQVTANGYAAANARMPAGGGAKVEFGTVLLTPPTQLEVRVTGDDRIRANAVHGSLAGSTLEPRRSADAEGRIVFEDLRAETQTLTLDSGTDWSVDFHLHLSSVRAEVLRTSFRRLRDLSVEIRPEPGAMYPSGSFLRATYRCRTAERRACWSAFIPESGTLDIGYLDADSIALEVADSAGASLGSVVLIDPDREGPVYVMRLGGPERAIRVVDPGGDPIPRSVVSVGRDLRVLDRVQVSGSDGVVHLGPYPADSVDMIVSVDGRGTQVRRGVELHRDVTDVPFDPSARARLLLLDAATPIGDVSVRIFDGYDAGILIERLQSDGHGAATSGALGRDAYEIVIDHPGIWSVRQRIDVVDAERVLPIALHRLGSVDIQVHSAGLPVAGCTVHLDSEEFGASVASWRSEGRCSSTPSDCRTDTNGQLVVDEIPRGAYRWRIDLADGRIVEGRFEVEPARRVPLAIHLP